jgi:hypothetical protein
MSPDVTFCHLNYFYAKKTAASNYGNRSYRRSICCIEVTSAWSPPRLPENLRLLPNLHPVPPPLPSRRRALPSAQIMQPYQPAGIDNRSYWTKLDTLLPAHRLLTNLRWQLPAIPDRLPMPTAAEYLSVQRKNDRSPLDDHWRQTRMGLSRLVVNRLLHGIEPSDPDDRLLNWLFDLTFQPTWMVSAHLPEHDLPGADAPELDLAACELAGELAEALELIGPWLSGQTQTLNATIVQQIDRRCLHPLVAGCDQAWAKLDGPSLNSWSGVCAGTLLAACLALEGIGQSRPEARKKALTILAAFWEKAFTPEGDCRQGALYWGYGIEGACVAMSRLSREEIEAHFNLPRIRQVAGYLERTCVDGNTFRIDGQTKCSYSPAIGAIGWLANFVQSDFLRQLVAKHPAGPGRTVNLLLRDLAIAPQIW